jgi:hypothetical protein
VRYTSDRDLALQEDISHIRRETEEWIHSGYEMLTRNQKSTNGKDYIPIVDMLSKINSEVEDWLVKIEKRVSGDDGIASLMIGLQNQVEDRYNAYSVRDMDKPLPAAERTQLRECLNSWTETINSLTSELCLIESPLQNINNFLSR